MNVEATTGAPTIGSHPKKPDDPKALHDAAQQFESFLIAQMLRSAREAGGADTSTGSDSASSSAMGMAEDAFAKALTQHGGLGLASLVEAGVQHASDAEMPAKGAAGGRLAEAIRGAQQLNE